MLTEELINQFNDYFTIHLVNSPKHYEDMCRLRYNVYIKEFKYDDETKFSEELEEDEYDKISIACVIYHNHTGKAAACVRLIPGSKCEQFPIEKYVGKSINQEILRELNNNRSNLAEISRLAVAREFRRREKEFLTPIGYYDEKEVRTYPLLSVACFLACITLSDIIDTEHHIASMEPFLPRFLNRYNLNFDKIGDLASYHGQRCSYLIHKTNVLNQLSGINEGFVYQIHNELFGQLLTIY